MQRAKGKVLLWAFLTLRALFTRQYVKGATMDGKQETLDAGMPCLAHGRIVKGHKVINGAF